jgi:DNA-binding HxlR family transcriptional regulator
MAAKEKTKRRRRKASTPTHKIGRTISDRWTRRIAEHGFTPVASVFLRAYTQLTPAPGTPGVKMRGLNSTEALLVIHLASFKWSAEDPFPRMNLLAERMGLSARSIRNAIVELEKRGLIKRVKNRDESVRRFEFRGLFQALERWIDGDTGSKAVITTSKAEDWLDKVFPASEEL